MKKIKFTKIFAAAVAAVLTVSSAPGLETPISKLLEKSTSVNADDTLVYPIVNSVAITGFGGFKLSADGKIMDGSSNVNLDDTYFKYDSDNKILKINNVDFYNSQNSEFNIDYVLDTSEVKDLTIEFGSDCKIRSYANLEQKPGCLKVADGTTIKCANGATLTLETTTGANPIYSDGSLTFENANIASNGDIITIYAGGSITFKNTNITSNGTDTPIIATDSINIINSSVKASSITSKTGKGITAENHPIIFNSSETTFESGKTDSITLDSTCAAEAKSSIITIDNRDVHDFGIFYNTDGKLKRGFGSAFDIITYIENIEIEEAGSTPVIKLSNFNFKTTNSTAISTSSDTTDITFELEGTNTLTASNNPNSLPCTPLSLVGGNCTIIGTSDKFDPENIDTLSLEGDDCEVFRCEKLNIEKADLIAQSSSSEPISMTVSSVTGKNLVIEGGQTSSDAVYASKAGVPITIHAGTAPYCVSSNVKIGKSNDCYGVYIDVNFFIPDYDSVNDVFGVSVNGGACKTSFIYGDSEANCRAIIKNVAPKDMANPIMITYNQADRTPVIYDKNGDKADFCMASVLADIYYNSNADWKEREFAKAMILYGSRAQTYFKTNTNSLASRYLAPGDVSWTSEAVAKSGVNSYTDKTTDYSEYIGQTLLLNNTAGIKTYVTDAFTGAFNVESGTRDITISQNNKELSSGITPDYFGYNMKGKFTVNGVDVDTCRLCVYDYVYTILNGKDYDQELKDLCCEIYNVGRTAKSFTGVEY